MNASERTPNGTPERLLDTRLDGHVATVALVNPAKRNALSERILDELITVCHRYERDGVRALILTARVERGVWSSGHDIEALPIDGRDPLHESSALERAIDAIRSVPFPVIAQVQGSVWGGAVEVVASCDIVVADESARFAITPARIGLPYNLEGLERFAERLSLGALRKMFFTAAPIEAQEALRIGLIDELVPASSLVDRAVNMAQRIAGNAPLAVAAVKQQLRALSEGRPLSQEWRQRIEATRRQAYESADFREGIQAFLEKRDPVFAGR